MASVQLNHIKKVYPNSEKKRKKGEQRGTTLKVTEEGVLAVEDFNLDIADREFIVLVGPSGCGKSTTLRMVAGLEEISGGDLIIDGKRVNDVAPKDRDIAMVFHPPMGFSRQEYWSGVPVPSPHILATKPQFPFPKKHQFLQGI